MQQFFINFISDVELNAISHWSHYIERKVSKKIFEEEAGNNKNTNQNNNNSANGNNNQNNNNENNQIKKENY